MSITATPVTGWSAWDYQQKDNHANSPILRADVIFGSPKLNCGGTGICKILNGSGQQPVQMSKDCRRAPAFLSSNPDGSELHIQLFREFVCINVYKNQLRKSVLNLEEACALPLGYDSALGLRSAILAPGTYAIREIDNCFFITIRVLHQASSPQR